MCLSNLKEKTFCRTILRGRSVARCPKPRNLINKLIKLQVRNFR